MKRNDVIPHLLRLLGKSKRNTYQTKSHLSLLISVISYSFAHFASTFASIRVVVYLDRQITMSRICTRRNGAHHADAGR
jgi:hypothetical protein